ncbi:MAG: hypothetical protein LQ349_007667 [Xanthoria aureola]|nr:MAG: hypothetical protein LQ349_007667 [Xanthoria aureola]
MRICILQSSRQGDPNHDTYADPSRFTEQHVFERHWIKEDSVEEQIEAALAAAFDLYWTSTYGQQAEETTELKVAKYLESHNIPFIGIPSRVLEKIGKKPHEQPLCATSSPLTTQSERPTLPAVSASGQASFESHGPGDDQQDSERAGSPVGNLLKRGVKMSQVGFGQDSENDGGYSILVIAMGSTVTPIPPARSQMDPGLCASLQETAVRTYELVQMQGCPWYTVDIRVQSDGALEVIGIDPRPDLFSSRGQTWEDAAVEQCFPGGHRALAECAIVTCQMGYGARTSLEHSLEEAYASWSKKYNASVAAISGVELTVLHFCKFDFQGSVLDLGCGTGRLGKSLPVERGSIVGIDISPHMAEIGKREGYYQDIRVGSIQKVLPTMPMFEHVVSLAALHHIPSVELSFVLSSAFQKARKSITFGIDDIPEGYNEVIRKQGPPWDAMQGHNHRATMESYVIPRDWRLADETRVFGWRSPNTGHDVFTTVYRFEHEAEQAASNPVVPARRE